MTWQPNNLFLIYSHLFFASYSHTHTFLISVEFLFNKVLETQRQAVNTQEMKHLIPSL